MYFAKREEPRGLFVRHFTAGRESVASASFRCLTLIGFMHFPLKKFVKHLGLRNKNKRYFDFSFAEKTSAIFFVKKSYHYFL